MDEQSTSAAGTSGAGAASSSSSSTTAADDDGGVAERQTEDAARLFRLRRHISDDTGASPSRTSPSSSSDQVDAAIPEVGYSSE